MNSRTTTTKLVGVFLFLTLSVPNYAYALRQTGLEESEGKDKPKTQLIVALTVPSVSPAAGAEEMAALTFRPLTSESLKLHKERLFELYRTIASDEPATMDHMLGERIDPRFSRVIFDDRGQIVGAAYVAEDSRAPGERVYLSSLMRDTARSDVKGTGELLIREAARAARNAGFQSMRFKVHAEQPRLRAFYENLGAKLIEVIPPAKPAFPSRALYELSFADLDAQAQGNIEKLNQQSLAFAAALTRPVKLAVLAGAYVPNSEPAVRSAEEALASNVERIRQLAAANSQGLVAVDFILVDDGSPVPIVDIVRRVFPGTEGAPVRLGMRYPLAPNVTMTIYSMKTALEAKAAGQLNESEEPVLDGIATTEGPAKDSVKGGAIALGMTITLGEGADYVVQTDFDPVLDVRQAFNLLRPLIDGTFQVAAGTRLSAAAPPVGRHLPHFYTERDDYYPLIRSLIPELKGIQDPQAGLKAYDANFLRESGLFSRVRDRFLTLDTEVILLAALRGARMGNVPVSVKLPEEGPPTTIADSADRKKYIERFLLGRDGKTDGLVRQMVRHKRMGPADLLRVYGAIEAFFLEHLHERFSMTREQFFRSFSGVTLEAGPVEIEVRINSDMAKDELLVNVINPAVEKLEEKLKSFPIFNQPSPLRLNGYFHALVFAQEGPRPRGLMIEFDEGRFLREIALSSVVHNGIDGILARIRAENSRYGTGKLIFWVERQVDKIVLVLSDDGIGIRQDILPRLFREPVPDLKRDGIWAGGTGTTLVTGDYGNKFVPVEIRTRHPETGAYRLRAGPGTDEVTIEKDDKSGIGTEVRWTFQFLAAGLEEKSAAQRIIAGQFKDAIHEALGNVDFRSVIPEGRGVVVDARIGDGVLSIAAALNEAHVPVIVVEPDPQKREATTRLLINVPVVTDVEAAVVLLAENGIRERIILNPAVTPTSAVALAYLKEIQILPQNLQLRPILEFGTQEGRFREQMGRYL